MAVDFKLSASAGKLLRKVQKHILEEPNRLLMDTYIRTGLVPGSVRRFDYDCWDGKRHTAPSCGTTACIAGWAILLSQRRDLPQIDLHRLRASVEIQERAQEVLGLLGRDRLPIFIQLVSVDRWLPPFREQYLSAKSSRKRARIAAAYIDHYIKVYGEETNHEKSRSNS